MHPSGKLNDERSADLGVERARLSGVGSSRFGSSRFDNRLRHSSAGVVMVEYSFLLVFFVLPVALATAAASVGLISGYTSVRNDLLHEYP